ncbi:MAG: pyridoxamine kinase [Clostridia bacterium]|nr:pyridoxamine kinase [Clostridia bacterium]
MSTKKILAVQDLSCVGQCSLTVVHPIMSAYGWETCVLPTAVLSNHTMFPKWSYLDLTPEIENIYSVWKEVGIKFDAYLLGYLGKASLMELAEKCFDEFSNDGRLIVIDPVFADNGKLYGGFDLNYVKDMAHLIRRADIILPNVTEACFLTGTEYKTVHTKEYIEGILHKLADLSPAAAVVTGVELDGKIGEAILSGGKVSYVMGDKIPVSFHGTGDIFAAVFTSHYLAGKGLEKSADLASVFVQDCIRATDKEHFYGVCFEKVLSKNL